MANFSTNQAKQLYVVNALKTSGEVSTLGDLKFGTTGEGDIFAKYFGRDGKVRTDLIAPKNIRYVNLAEAADQVSYPEAITLTPDAPIAGQHYIINVTIDEFGGMSPEDKGFIFADYVAKTNDTVAKLIANLAVSLAKNASKAAYSPLISVGVMTGNGMQEVTAASIVADIEEANPTALVIVAVEQPWSLGKQSFELPHFSVTTVPVVSNGMDTQWATISTVQPRGSAIANSKKIADLEYFCAGERGDVYRGMGYPNNFDFQPMIDPTSADGYDVVTIGYFWQGNAEDIQKSPKEILFVAPSGTGQSIYNAFTSLLPE